VLEPVKGIGSRAIFIGHRRCLAVVDADKFPSVEANCIYHVRGMNPSAGIYVHHVYKYCLRDGTEEMISEAISWSDPFRLCSVSPSPAGKAAQSLSPRADQSGLYLAPAHSYPRIRLPSTRI
jgi:hypothetical protein